MDARKVGVAAILAAVSLAACGRGGVSAPAEPATTSAGPSTDAAAPVVTDAPQAGTAAGPAEGWGPLPPPAGWDQEFRPNGDAWRKVKQELSFNNGADIETLDPAQVTGVPEHKIFMAVYEGLMIYDPKTAAPRPGVAETWTISPDGRTYTFKLRADAKWSNGAPVTAQDFRFAWWRVLSPQPPSQYSYMLHDIDNAKAYDEGRIAETVLPLHEDADCSKGNGASLQPGDVVDVVETSPKDVASADPAKVAVRVKRGEQVLGWVRKQALRGSWRIDGPAFKKVGLEAPDARTLVVRLEIPRGYFLDLLAHQTPMPVHQATVEKLGDAAFRAENFVGNGTHVIKEFKVREHILLEKSSTYWNRANVYLERIKALPMDNLEAAYAKYLAGECDWLMAIPPTKVDEIKLNPDFYANRYFGTYFFRINCTPRKHPDGSGRPHPLTDRRVRQALNLAIDKKTIVTRVTKAGEIPAQGFVPPGVRGYDPLQGTESDRERARKLFAEAGYPEGKGFPSVEILYNTSESHKLIAEAVQGMWENTLGIVVGASNTEWKVYLDQVDRIDYQIARAGWIGDYLDPKTFLDLFVTDGGNNSTGWSNAGYDALIEAARVEADPAKRLAHFRRAEQILCVEELPVIPIYYYVNKGMKQPKVQGILDNILDLHPWQYIWIEPEE